MLGVFTRHIRFWSRTACSNRDSGSDASAIVASHDVPGSDKCHSTKARMLLAKGGAVKGFARLCGAGAGAPAGGLKTAPAFLLRASHWPPFAPCAISSAEYPLTFVACWRTFANEGYRPASSLTARAVSLFVSRHPWAKGSAPTEDSIEDLFQ
jgi:hypothetical protein